MSRTKISEAISEVIVEGVPGRLKVIQEKNTGLPRGIPEFKLWKMSKGILGKKKSARIPCTSCRQRYWQHSKKNEINFWGHSWRMIWRTPGRNPADDVEMGEFLKELLAECLKANFTRGILEAEKIKIKSGRIIAEITKKDF